MSKPCFSLIVTTRWGARHKDLERLFQSLQRQRAECFELILIVQSAESVGAPEISNSLPSLKHLQVVVVPPCSLSRARNIGLQHAQHGIIAFPDDDCWYSDQLLDQVSDRLTSGDLDVICTSVFDPISRTSYGKRPLDIEMPINWWNAFSLPVSVGLFFRRECLATAGFDLAKGIFDERFGAGTWWGAGEESDVICALLRARLRIIYNGHIRVYHQVGSYSESDISKYLSYGRGFGAAIGKRLAMNEFRPLYVLADCQVRSAAGFLVNTVRGRSVHARTYLNRGVGSFLGLLEGFRHYRNVG